PVTHERTFRLLKPSGALVIVDRLSGRGEHDLRWHFHLAPGVSAEPVNETTVVLAASGVRCGAAASRACWRLMKPAGLRGSMTPAFYSPSYGVKTPCIAIDMSARVTLDGDRQYDFGIYCDAVS